MGFVAGSSSHSGSNNMQSARFIRGAADDEDIGTSHLMELAEQMNMGLALTRALEKRYEGLSFNLQKTALAYLIVVKGFDELNCLQLCDDTRTIIDDARQNGGGKSPAAIISLSTAPIDYNGDLYGDGTSRCLFLRVQPVDVTRILDVKCRRRRAFVCMQAFVFASNVAIAFVAFAPIVYSFIVTLTHRFQEQQEQQ